jgi:excisionase family DNA binding protein
MERLLTIREFCERNGIGRSTVYRENKAKRLPFRKVGRATRIAESDAGRWQETLLVSGRASTAL